MSESKFARECKFAQLVDAYCDGELPIEQEEEMHRHVFACAACSARVRQTRAITEQLSGAAPRAMPDRALDRVHTAVASGWTSGALRLAWWMSGVAAAVLVGASVWVARMGDVQTGGGQTATQDWGTTAVKYHQVQPVGGNASSEERSAPTTQESGQ